MIDEKTIDDIIDEFLESFVLVNTFDNRDDRNMFKQKLKEEGIMKQECNPKLDYKKLNKKAQEFWDSLTQEDFERIYLKAQEPYLKQEKQEPTALEKARGIRQHPIGLDEDIGEHYRDILDCYEEIIKELQAK